MWLNRSERPFVEWEVEGSSPFMTGESGKEKGGSARMRENDTKI